MPAARRSPILKRVSRPIPGPHAGFGLSGQVTRNGRAGSRLLDAKTIDIEAASRRDADARWRWATRDGLSAEQAAEAVGVERSTLHRWEKAPEPKSRRPRRARQKSRSPRCGEPSSASGRAFRCRQEPRPVPFCALRASPSPTLRPGAFWPASQPEASFSPSRPCAPSLNRASVGCAAQPPLTPSRGRSRSRSGPWAHCVGRPAGRCSGRDRPRRRRRRGSRGCGCWG